MTDSEFPGLASRVAWDQLPEVSSLASPIPTDLQQELLAVAPDDILQSPQNFSPNILSADAQTQLQRLHKIVTSGCGLVTLQAQQLDDDHKLRCLYAVIARSFGQLNDRYGHFFDVIDRSRDHTREAIPVSVTNAATGYHTDSTAKDYFPDVVGLLCLSAAAEGGDSLVCNAANAFLSIAQESPELLPWLTQPIPRDMITPGFGKSLQAISENLIPLFATDQHGLYFRFMRYWIETAFMKLRRRQPEELTATLDRIDQYFAEPGHCLQFSLHRGDLLFVNNRFLCHNRTAFRDSGEPRRLVRAWINIPTQPVSTASPEALDPTNRNPLS